MSNWKPIERVAVRLLSPWNGRRAGFVIPQMDSRIANDLIEHGRAEAFEEPEPEPEPIELEQEEPAKKTRKTKKKSTED